MEKVIDLKKTELNDLKALAYDFFNEYNLVRKKLEMVNSEIQARLDNIKVIDKTEKEVNDGENISDNEGERRA